MMETLRSSPAFAVGGVAPAFACVACGCETATYPFAAVRSVCPKHCPDHDYEYDRFDRRHYCTNCGEEPSPDWYYSDDDVCLFGGSLGGSMAASGPIGIPASAMNGNAMQRDRDPGAWDRWVAFCNANGHP